MKANILITLKFAEFELGLGDDKIKDLIKGL